MAAVEARRGEGELTVERSGRGGRGWKRGEGGGRWEVGEEWGKRKLMGSESSERKAMDVTRRGEEVGRWWDRFFAHLVTIPPTSFAGFTLD